MFHRYVSNDIDQFHLKRGSRRAYIAPRGSGKSIWLSLVYALRSICEGWEKYIVILSDTPKQTRKFIRDLKEELELNPLIKEHYPAAHGQGLIWASDEFESRNTTKVEGYSRNQAIRGARRAQYRPTLVIADDVQKNKDIYSKIMREKTLDWFTREIIPIGDRNTNYISVGTALHRDCVAVQAQTLAMWKGKTFKAIMDWPVREDLWEAWERKLTNLSDPDAVDNALAMFDKNRAEMLRGSAVLWEHKSLYELMCTRAEIGRKAFDTEFQAKTDSGGFYEFPAEYFDYPGFYFDSWPRLTLKRYSLDPSKGAGDKPGDWQAHVWGGVGEDGILYVDAEFDREPVHGMIARSVDCLYKFGGMGGLAGTEKVILETNSFGDSGDLAIAEFNRQVAERKMTRPKFQRINNTEQKEVRIRRLDNRLARKTIRVRNTRGGQELVKQLRNLFSDEHDDGPDALEMLQRDIDAGVSVQIAKAKAAVADPRASQPATNYDFREQSF